MSLNEFENLIYSFSLNCLVVAFFQFSEIYLRSGLLRPLFLLELEISLLLFVFQLGALKIIKETGTSLDDYFEEFGGLLVVFAIMCLILNSFASMVIGDPEIKLSELIIKN